MFVRIARLRLSNGRRFYYAFNKEGFKEFLRGIEVEFIGGNRIALWDPE